MAFRSPSDVAPISPNQPSFGILCQTKVSGDRQRETTHKSCCLAAEFKYQKNKKFALNSDNIENVSNLSRKVIQICKFKMTLVELCTWSQVG